MDEDLKRELFCKLVENLSNIDATLCDSSNVKNKFIYLSDAIINPDCIERVYFERTDGEITKVEIYFTGEGSGCILPLLDFNNIKTFCNFFGVK